MTPAEFDRLASAWLSVKPAPENDLDAVMCRVLDESLKQSDGFDASMWPDREWNDLVDAVRIDLDMFGEESAVKFGVGLVLAESL